MTQLFTYSSAIPEERIEELNQLVEGKKHKQDVIALQSSVYVSESFDEASIATICEIYPYIISLSLFESWLLRKSPFPLNTKNPVVFSSIFSGLVLSTSQLSSKQRKVVSTYASYMGGYVTHCYTSTVSHLITEVPNTQKFLLALKRGDSIVNPSWITDCWTTGQLLSVDKYTVRSPSPKTCKPEPDDLKILSPPLHTYNNTIQASPKPQLPLAGCIISVSGYSSQQRQSIKQIVMQLGGSYSIGLTRHVSHFLCENTKRKKFSEARALAIPFCITGSWLEACLQEKKRVDEKKYFLIAPPLDPALRGFAYLQSIQIRFNQVAASPGSIFNGIHFRTEAFEAEEVSDLSEVLRSYGAASINALDRFLQVFLIVPHGYDVHSGTSSEEKLFTITANWIERCIEEGKLLDPTSHILFSPLSCLVPMEGTKGKSVCISGISSKERRNFRMLLIVLGFKYEECLTRCVDYLITKPPISASSNKCRGAREWNIPQIHHEWILTSAKVGKLLPISSYYMETPALPLPAPVSMVTTHISIPSRSPSPVHTRSPSPVSKRSPVIVASGEPYTAIVSPHVSVIAKTETPFQPSWDSLPVPCTVGVKRALPLLADPGSASITPKRKKQKQSLSFASSAAKAFAEHNLEELPPSERKREKLLSEFGSFDENTVAAIDLCLSPIAPVSPTSNRTINTSPQILTEAKEEEKEENIEIPRSVDEMREVVGEDDITPIEDDKCLEGSSGETQETEEKEEESFPAPSASMGTLTQVEAREENKEEDIDKKQALNELERLLSTFPMEKENIDPIIRKPSLVVNEEPIAVQKMSLRDFECSQQSEDSLFMDVHPQGDMDFSEASYDDQIVVCNQGEPTTSQAVDTGRRIDIASFCAQFDTSGASSFCIGFSSIDHALKKRLKEIVSSLGGSVVDSAVKLPHMTHLITQKPSRSLKYLSALAKGSWILRAEFLWASEKQNRWADETSFVVASTGFSPALYWRRTISNGGESVKPFYGMKIALFTKKSYEADISQVLQLGGASVLYTLSHSGPIEAFFHTITLAIMDDSLVTKGEVLEHLKAFQKNNIPCISARYISDYLLQHPTTTRKEYELTLKKRSKPCSAKK